MITNVSNQQEEEEFSVLDQNELPPDSVSAIAWTLDSGYIACASWDSNVYFYQLISQAATKPSLKLAQRSSYVDPILSLTWLPDMSFLFTASINGEISAYDINNNSNVGVGKHDHAVNGIYWLENVNLLCTHSLDQTIRFWDLRQQQSASVFNVGKKVFCSDLIFPYLLLGLSDEKILLCDLNKIDEFLNPKNPSYVDSPLGTGSQVTSVALNPSLETVAIASHDGRVNYSQIQNHTKISTQMNWRAHIKKPVGSSQCLYPVHTIGFHPKSKAFLYTGGGEGGLSFWDLQKKSPIKQWTTNSSPVLRAKINPSGNMLAYARGYDWSKGIQYAFSEKSVLAVKTLKDSDLPK